MVAGFNDVPVASIGKLGAENLTHSVTHLKHSANPGTDGGRKCQGFESVAMTDNDLSLVIGQPALFDSADGRDLLKV